MVVGRTTGSWASTTGISTAIKSAKWDGTGLDAGLDAGFDAGLGVAKGPSLEVGLVDTETGTLTPKACANGLNLPDIC